MTQRLSKGGTREQTWSGWQQRIVVLGGHTGSGIVLEGKGVQAPESRAFAAGARTLRLSSKEPPPAAWGGAGAEPGWPWRGGAGTGAGTGRPLPEGPLCVRWRCGCGLDFLRASHPHWTSPAGLWTCETESRGSSPGSGVSALLWSGVRASGSLDPPGVFACIGEGGSGAQAWLRRAAAWKRCACQC